MGPRGSALLFLDDFVDAGGHIPLCVLFQPADAAVQLGEALGHDIRQILLIQVIGGVDGLVVDAHGFYREWSVRQCRNPVVVLPDLQ